MISPEHQSLRQLYDHWQRLKGDRNMPRRREFDPVDLPGNVLPHLFLIEIGEGEADYRLRLMGTYMRDAYGREFTRCRLVDQEMPGITNSVTYRLLAALVQTHEPQYALGPASFRFNDWYTEAEQIILPLADDGGRLAFAIGSVYYPNMRKRIA